MKNNLEIGKQLAQLRHQKQWTQAQLADKLNVSRQAVSKWETGSALPDLELLLQLSELYEVTINGLITETTQFQLKTIEDLSTYSPDACRRFLVHFTANQLALASKGMSPELSALIEQSFPEVNFIELRATIGRVPLTAIETIHEAMVAEINKQLKEK